MKFGTMDSSLLRDRRANRSLYIWKIGSTEEFEHGRSGIRRVKQEKPIRPASPPFRSRRGIEQSLPTPLNLIKFIGLRRCRIPLRLSEG
jgi:hypothetical protein